ncbi:MAG: hypothetical protein HFG41_02435 [Coprococcus sp.]|nr:hypothetical protein [Coprococcus sp.]
MLLVLLLLGLALAILTMFLFQGVTLFGILSLAVLSAGIILYFLRKKLPGKLGEMLAVLAFAAGFVLLGFGGMKVQENGFSAYEERLEDMKEALQKGKFDRAMKLAEDMEEDYGEDDNLRMLRAVKELSQGDYESAYEEMSGFSDQHSQTYYALMEQIYIEDPSEESVEAIYDLYLKAAKDWPDWTHMQLYAGISLFEQEKYGNAVYYLLRAVDQENEDYKGYYYLGAANYYQADYENCRYYFNEVLKREADDKTKGYIAWYMERIEKGGKEE